ncbi:competence protein [Oceanobacillus arenosus]|uniref:Competence protein n=1 Tax=Oceanobacillus arenosus TaxID=1229153 RepID=A0A3D8PTC8_9BACI|nr:competence protein ComK [Oceanobacillus arenosus]RDW18508.1 competence protein [Oceanobacillus arenosus]
MMKDFYTPYYEVTPLTLAVVAEKGRNGETITRVLEEEVEYVVDFSPSKVIDYACKFFGSSLKGRQEGTLDICGITHKAPVSVDPISGMYFFPTTSPKNLKCSWIAHSHIDQINKAGENSTEFVFKNGKKIKLQVSYGSMLNQVQRTAQYRYLLDNRIKYLQRKNAEKMEEPPQ